jgi:hypothetical protein
MEVVMSTDTRPTGIEGDSEAASEEALDMVDDRPRGRLPFRD